MKSVLLATAACGFIAAGCGGVPKATRTALAVAAGAVTAADVVSAPIAEAKRRDCYDSLPEGAEFSLYAQCVHGADALVEALHIAKRATETTEAALDAWADGAGDGGFFASVPCMAAAIVRLVGTLETLGVVVPPDLLRAVDLARAFGGVCQ